MKIIDTMPQELLDAMNKFSIELEWARRLPIYEIHKWWARRYSGIIRLILAFNELDERILEKVDDFHTFIKDVYFHPPKVKGKKLLDPFCGGGTIVIESAKIGYESYGIEINKLPYLMLSSLKKVPRLDFKFIENKIIQISNDLEDVWTTKCIKGHDAKIIHTFLAWKNKRGQLQIKFNKLRNDGKEKIYFCEKCRKIYTSTKELNECTFCKNQFNKNFEKIEYVSLIPYAIEYFCNSCNKRAFKIATPIDQKKFNIKFEWNLFEIPPLNETTRLLKVGIRRFDQLLTPRQKLTFQKFLNSFKIKPYKTIAKLLVSDSLRSCSLLAYYSAEYKKVIAGFVIKSYWLPPQPVELNPLSFKFSSSGDLLPLGRGNIISNLKKFKKAKEFIEDQQMPLNFKIYYGPAQDIIPKLNSTFDLIFTDPPYGDYQFYSDLSLFSLSVINEINFNSLKKLLKKEIVLRKKKDIAKYKKKLYQVFSLATNKLSKNGKIIITFHHPDINILYEILDIFKNLSLNLHAIYPVIGESSGQLVKRKIYLDLVFIFGKKRKTPHYAFTSYSLTKYDEQLQHSIKDLIQFYEV
jgi:16S rRNA G966 N2-methylase RsmD